MKNPFRIPNITQSLEADVRTGAMSIEEATKELYLANLLPYIDLARAKTMLHVDE